MLPAVQYHGYAGQPTSQTTIGQELAQPPDSHFTVRDGGGGVVERSGGTYSKAGEREGNQRNIRGEAMGRWQGGLQRAGGRRRGGQRRGRRKSPKDGKDRGSPPALSALDPTRQ